MQLKLDITPAIYRDSLCIFVEDQNGNRVFGDGPFHKLTDIVTAFTKENPDQDYVEDLIEALEDSLRIACAYKVKEFI